MTIADAKVKIDALFAALKAKYTTAVEVSTLTEVNLMVDAALPTIVSNLPSETTAQQLMDGLFTAARAAAPWWAGFLVSMVQALADKELAVLYPTA